MSLRGTLVRWLLRFYKRYKRSHADLGLDNCLRAVRETAARTRYCFLVTMGADAWPSARLVEPICDPESFVFHIGTHPASRKIREIAACPQVTLAFGNAAENANLVVYGTATVSAEPATRRRYWKGLWRLFFPDGPGGSDYVVVRVEAQRMELMSFRHNVVAEPFGLRPMVIVKTGSGWAIPDAAEPG